jgi:hypothetical protein
LVTVHAVERGGDSKQRKEQKKLGRVTVHSVKEEGKLAKYCSYGSVTKLKTKLILIWTIETFYCHMADIY